MTGPGPGDAGRAARLTALEDALTLVLAHDEDQLTWRTAEALTEALQLLQHERRTT